MFTTSSHSNQNLLQWLQLNNFVFIKPNTYQKIKQKQKNLTQLVGN